MRDRCQRKRAFDSSWALWLSVLVAWAEGSRGLRGIDGDGRSRRSGAQRIVLLSPVTDLRYRVRTNSVRRKENHLFIKQGSSPALPNSRMPRAKSALLNGCEQLSSSSNSSSSQQQSDSGWPRNLPVGL